MSMYGKQLRMGDLISRKQQVLNVYEKKRRFQIKTLIFSLWANRMETRLKSKEGINYAEFSYQVFQAYDWFYLYQNHNCTIQVLIDLSNFTFYRQLFSWILDEFIINT